MGCLSRIQQRTRREHRLHCVDRPRAFPRYSLASPVKTSRGQVLAGVTLLAIAIPEQLATSQLAARRGFHRDDCVYCRNLGLRLLRLQPDSVGRCRLDHRAALRRGAGPSRSVLFRALPRTRGHHGGRDRACRHGRRSLTPRLDRGLSFTADRHGFSLWHWGHYHRAPVAERSRRECRWRHGDPTPHFVVTRSWFRERMVHRHRARDARGVVDW